MCGVSAGSFAEYLSSLDEEALTALLRARPDVRVQPVPRGFTQLAQRLGGPDSLVAALRTLDRDAVNVGRAVAALGAAATTESVARLLRAPEELTSSAVARLRGRGLAWDHDGVLHLPERLADHWAAEIGGGRPALTIARTMVVEDLRVAATGLGIETAGLLKAKLVERVCEVLADGVSLAETVARLPAPVRKRLDDLRTGEAGAYYYSAYDTSYGVRYGYARRRPGDVTDALVHVGLLLPVNGRPELPREVAVAVWLAGSATTLTGPPELGRATTTSADVRRHVQGAAQEALLGVTALLDEARSTPIAALKKGGIGPRERTRLAKRLSMTDDALVLWIDLAYAAGLLTPADAGYAPTDGYPSWRAAEPGVRWAALATAWFALEHAPTSREIDGDREQPPPLPLASAAGPMRRALFAAVTGGASVRAAADGTASLHAAAQHIDWYFPLHDYPADQRDIRVAAAVREAELLGVACGDVVSELGGHLHDTAGESDPVGELALRCAPLLPAAEGGVIVQSDLTAVVSGQPSEAVSRLLAAAAIAETRGAAGIWRFTPASVRAALDAGWTADDLLAELKTVSDRPVPQPLEYLITDAARKHGTVRVRGMRSCIVTSEPLATEILHTRSLTKLHLSQVAPTVLASPFELDEVLAKLRAAGLSPVAEDALGVAIVESRPEHLVSTLRSACQPSHGPGSPPWNWRPS